MSITSFFLNKVLPWNPSGFPTPWDAERQSHFDFIIANDSGSSADLPDTAQFNKDGEIRWVSGAMDSLFGHGDDDGQKRSASKVYTALKAFLKRPTEKGLQELYAVLMEFHALDYVNDLTDFVEAGGIDRGKLQDLAKWLCRVAPDREPVKTAIALLGMCQNTENVEIFRVFGRHDEFAMFALVALSNSLPDPEMEIWLSAKSIDGWGKINAVERLAATTNPEIKAWLLREGCSNSIMNEYLAYICATTGDLLEALKGPDPDEALLTGSADIIEALMCGGPAQDMFDYADGSETLQLFVDHLKRRPLSLRVCTVLTQVRTFVLNEDAEWDRQSGWSSETRQQIATSVQEVLDKENLAERIAADLEGDDDQAFYYAINIADYLGMDVWAIYFGRQTRKKASWYNLMQTDDPSRIEQVLDLARQQLNLSAVASGPTMEVAGHGPRYKEYADHRALDFIVQDLRRFPNKGWDLIKVSFKSPLIRNRNVAMQALSKWGYENWPSDAKDVLVEAATIEPDATVKLSIERLLTDHVLD